MKKLKIIDLFAGCGGLTDGFEQTGLFKTIACVEWEKASRDTLVKRLREKWGYLDADSIVLRFDIQRVKKLFEGWTDDPVYGTGHGLDRLVIKSRGIDIIIGGPPCQAYSVAGRIRDEHGMHYDYRNYLFESYIKVLKYYKPRIFIFENVPGMLSAKPGGTSIVERITEGFFKAGYVIADNLRKKTLIDLTEYGVPQLRKRVFILGLNRKYFKGNYNQLFIEFYDKILKTYKTHQKTTVSTAISDLPKFYPVKNEYKNTGKKFSHKPEKSSIPSHIPRYHNKRDIAIFMDLADDILSGVNKYKSIKELKKLYTKRTGKKSSVHKYYVLRWNKPSNTVPAHLYKDGLRHIHPDSEQARSITVREAARLQSFYDSFIFLGSMGDQYKMVGNAVPPLFAKKLGYALHDFLENKKGG